MAKTARAALRGCAFLAVVGVASIAVSPAVAPPRALAAAALVMGGTGGPDPTKSGDYLSRVAQEFLDPITSCRVSSCRIEPVIYPAEFWPIPEWGGPDGLTFDRSVAEGVVNLDAALQHELTSDPDESIAVFGISQSASAVTIVKRQLAGASPQVKSRLEMLVLANPNRPNGGVLSRFYPLSIPIIEFSANGATPTDVGIKTTDIAFQYDIAADFPRYPLNLFALLNSLIGIDVHGTYTTTRNCYSELELQQAIDNPANRQTFGDTTYITIPTKDLPLVQPLRQFGAAQGISAIVEPLVALIEPTLRVLVELGYDRSTEYGRPTPAGLFPLVDPGKLMSDLAAAVHTGIADARTEMAAAQPLSRTPAAITAAAPAVADDGADDADGPPTRRAAVRSHRHDDDARPPKAGPTHRNPSSTRSNRHADESEPDSARPTKSDASEGTGTPDSGASKNEESSSAEKTSDRESSHRESVGAS